MENNKDNKLVGTKLSTGELVQMELEAKAKLEQSKKENNKKYSEQH